MRCPQWGPTSCSTAALQLAAHYPATTIGRLADDAVAGPLAPHTRFAESRLAPDVFPIRRYPQFDDTLNRNVLDPLTAIHFRVPCTKGRCSLGEPYAIILHVRTCGSPGQATARGPPGPFRFPIHSLFRFSGRHMECACCLGTGAWTVTERPIIQPPACGGGEGSGIPGKRAARNCLPPLARTVARVHTGRKREGQRGTGTFFCAKHMTGCGRQKAPVPVPIGEAADDEV